MTQPTADNPTRCPGSGTVPTETWTTVTGIALRYGKCPACDGNYRVEPDGTIIEHRPV